MGRFISFLPAAFWERRALMEMDRLFSFRLASIVADLGTTPHGPRRPAGVDLKGEMRMLELPHRTALQLSALITGAMMMASPALAIPQFTTTTTALLHTLGSGEPGASYTSRGVGQNGQIVYTSASSALDIMAEVDTLNYYDPSNPACATDAGSNCIHNFATGLTFEIHALYDGLSITDYGGGYYGIELMFKTTAGTDITWRDPTDGNSLQLEADWTAGLFNGNPTTGLIANVLYDTNPGGGLIGNIDVVGFATITGGSYASLFGSQAKIMLNLSQFFDFNPSFDVITQQVLANQAIPDFTAEVQGQIFRVATGEFVPEPSTGLMLGLGLAALGFKRRSR
jgi:hypothetical protein